MEGTTFFMPNEDSDGIGDTIGKTQWGRRIGSAGVATITDLIVRLSRLVLDVGSQLAELDINPIALVNEGTQALALDALAIVGSGEPWSDLDQVRPLVGAQN